MSIMLLIIRYKTIKLTLILTLDDRINVNNAYTNKSVE